MLDGLPAQPGSLRCAIELRLNPIEDRLVLPARNPAGPVLCVQILERLRI